MQRFFPIFCFGRSAFRCGDTDKTAGERIVNCGKQQHRHTGKQKKRLGISLSRQPHLVQGIQHFSDVCTNRSAVCNQQLKIVIDLIIEIEVGAQKSQGKHHRKYRFIPHSGGQQRGQPRQNAGQRQRQQRQQEAQ